MGLLCCFGRHDREDIAEGARPASTNQSGQAANDRLQAWVNQLPAEAGPSTNTTATQHDGREGEIAEERKPKTGLRKRGTSVAKHDDPVQPSYMTPSRPKKPPQYLYFGEGGQQNAASRPAAGHGAGRPGANISPIQSGYSVEGVATIPGRDASGFQSTGISAPVTAPMGYQNLTYGGALQMDYAETHG